MKKIIALLLSITMAIPMLYVTTPAQEITNETILGAYKAGEALVLYKQSGLLALSTANELEEGIEIVDTLELEKQSEINLFSLNESKTVVSLVKSDKYSTQEIMDRLGDNSNVLIVEPNYELKLLDENISSGAIALADETTTTAETATIYESTTEATTEEQSETPVRMVANEITEFSSQIPDYNSVLWGFKDESMGINTARTQNEGKELSENIVAVLDTGVDYTQPDLIDKMWHNPYSDLAGEYGYDFNNDDDDPMPEAGYANQHGTHVAGTIAADNNGMGIDGISPNTKIMAIKILGNSNSCTYHALAAMDYVIQAKDRGANIVAVNNSWGGISNSKIISYAFDQLYERGILSFVSSGNSTVNSDIVPMYPVTSTSKGCVAVDATWEWGNDLAVYSNYGAHTTDIATPGSQVLSTLRYPYYNNFEKEKSSVYYDFEDGNNQPIIIENSESAFGASLENMPYTNTKAFKIGNVDYNTFRSVLLYVGKKKDLPNKLSASYTFSSNVTDESVGYMTKVGFAYLNKPYADIVDNKISNADIEEECIIYDASGKIGKSMGRVACRNYADIEPLEPEQEVYLLISVKATSSSDAALNSYFVDDVSVGDASYAQQYGLMNGTSMAAPNAAGSAAYIKSLYPDMSVDELRARMVGGAVKSDGLKDYCRADGYFNMPKALNNPNAYIGDVSYANDVMTINGYFFGDTANTITLGDKPLTVISWSDNEIKVKLDSTESIVKDLNVEGKDGGDSIAIRTSDFVNPTAELVGTITNPIPQENDILLNCAYSYGDNLFQVIGDYAKQSNICDTCVIKKNMAQLSQTEEVITLLENSYPIYSTTVGDTLYTVCLTYSFIDGVFPYNLVAYNMQSGAIDVSPFYVAAAFNAWMLYNRDGSLYLFCIDSDSQIHDVAYHANIEDLVDNILPSIYEDVNYIYTASYIDNKLVLMSSYYSDKDGACYLRPLVYDGNTWTPGKRIEVYSERGLTTKTVCNVGTRIYIAGVVSEEYNSVIYYDTATNEWTNVDCAISEFPYDFNIAVFNYNNGLYMFTDSLVDGKYSIYKLPVNFATVGDVDMDGYITATDAAFALQYALSPGSLALSAEQLSMADVDIDGYITATDAAKILQKSLDYSYEF